MCGECSRGLESLGGCADIGAIKGAYNRFFAIAGQFDDLAAAFDHNGSSVSHGTVTRASAQGDERLEGSGDGPLTTPVPWSWTVFLSARHKSLLGNPTFQNNLLHILVERPPNRSRTTAVSSAD